MVNLARFGAFVNINRYEFPYTTQLQDFADVSRSRRRSALKMLWVDVVV